MPIIKSAKKKVRQDKKRRIVNLKNFDKYKTALSLARKKPTLTNIKAAESLIDQAAKKKIIHKNKASRLISRLTKKMGSDKQSFSANKPKTIVEKTSKTKKTKKKIA